MPQQTPCPAPHPPLGTPAPHPHTPHTQVTPHFLVVACAWPAPHCLNQTLLQAPLVTPQDLLLPLPLQLLVLHHVACPPTALTAAAPAAADARCFASCMSLGRWSCRRAPWGRDAPAHKCEQTGTDTSVRNPALIQAIHLRGLHCPSLHLPPSPIPRCPLPFPPFPLGANARSSPCRLLHPFSLPAPTPPPHREEGVPQRLVCGDALAWVKRQQRVEQVNAVVR